MMMMPMMAPVVVSVVVPRANSNRWRNNPADQEEAAKKG